MIHTSFELSYEKAPAGVTLSVDVYEDGKRTVQGEEVASRGDLRRMRELAEKNAQLALAQDKLRREHRRQQRVESLSALQDALGLERVPVRIEGFDISNLGETHTVASMVVFEGAAPRKSDYRKFNIRGDFAGNGEGPYDFAAMQEVLSSRLGRYVHVSPESTRQVVAGDEGLSYLVIGAGTDGYEVRDPF